MTYKVTWGQEKGFITADNEQIAKFCTLYAGRGLFNLYETNSNKIVLESTPMGTWDSDFADTFDYYIIDYIKNNYNDILKCYESFESENGKDMARYFDCERNNIAKKFKI